VAFGDIFLEDVRRYREEQLAQVDMEGIFPLWGKDSHKLAREFIDSGFKAIITCTDSRFGCSEFAGRDYDDHLLTELPSIVDPCFENGECHSFVYDGPIFQWPVKFVKGEIILRDEQYYYCDLIGKRSRDRCTISAPRPNKSAR
jgi:diphthamide synthase (EF-2-diphthine--ammonia ligase)